MSTFKSRLVPALVIGLATAGTAMAIDLGGALGAGAKAGKAMTLTDKEVIDSAVDACAYMHKNHSIAAPGSTNGKRLATIVQGLDKEDGLSLSFKV